jgi:predicted nucleotidyltransferase
MAANSLSPPLQPFKPLLKDLSCWLHQADVRGAIIGGVAASIWGRPRTMRDVDLTVILEEEKWPALFEAGLNAGFEPRLPDALEFATQSRVLLMRHTVSGLDVDLTFGLLAFEVKMLERAVLLQLNGENILLCSPEDLIVMKLLAGRARDIADIESVLEAQSNLDLSYIRQCAGELASFLEAPELVSQLDNLLALQQKLRRKNDT